MIVGIADLGIGNFAAMGKMLDQLGAEARRLDDPALVDTVDRLVLPGVGAFDFAARMLDDRGWRGTLQEVMTQAKKPVLAVCVGMQLLVSGSDEGPGNGLNWIPGHCRRFESPHNNPIKVPHMGWSSVESTQRNLLLGQDVRDRYFFVHSYFVNCPPQYIVAECTYGVSFPAIIQRDLVWGVQFHPEKSHRFGLDLLQRFLDVPC